MNFDLNCLCQLLASAPDEEIVSSEGCNAYLMEKVFRPMLRGEPPRIGEIDYGQFEEDDIGIVAAYFDRLWYQAQKIEQFVGAVSSIDPAACKVRRFC